MLVAKRLVLLGVEILVGGAFVALGSALQRPLQGLLELRDHARDVLGDELARDARAVRQALQHRGLDLRLGFFGERGDERRHDEGHEASEVIRVARLPLLRRGFAGAQNVRKRRHRGFAHVLVEVEVQERHHRLHGGSDVVVETLLELVHVAAQHVARGGFLLQRGRADRDPLVADGDDLNLVVLVLVVHGSVFQVGDPHVRLQPRGLQQGRHHHLQVRDEVRPEALAQPRPGLLHVRRRLVVVLEAPSLQAHERVHHFFGVLRETLLPDSHADQRDALHRLRA